MLKNDLYLKALRGETVVRPPVWLMRQAGRYLPEFQKIKAKYDFFTRCQTPELAAEITVQPLRRYVMDATILFSDILVVPQAMGIRVEMKNGIGPWLPSPITSEKEVENINVSDVEQKLDYVFKAVQLTKQLLENSVPLIGFAGAPWTIFCYCIQGQSSKNFEKAKALCFTNPTLAHSLLQKITNTTIAYLKKKVLAGCDAIQIFDSWGGLLSPADYDEFSWGYLQQIVTALKQTTPVVVFGKGCWFALEKMTESGANALGIDWTISPEKARKITGNKITLQGNFDPHRLLSPPKKITEMVRTMIDSFGTQKYIVNLGHGILPNIPLENVSAFIEAVKNYEN